MQYPKFFPLEKGVRMPPTACAQAELPSFFLLSGVARTTEKILGIAPIIRPRQTLLLHVPFFNSP